MNRKPKKSEAITVTPFDVTTRWVSVEINVSHITAKMCALPEIGLLRVVSKAVIQLADSVSIHADYRPGSTPEEIIQAMRGSQSWRSPLMFLGHHPGQKLMPIEMRMEDSVWEMVKAAAAALEVSVVVFCQEALHQRSIQIAEYRRNLKGERDAA